MDTGADHEWVDWLRGLLKTGADALGAQPVGDPVLGLRGRTAGCRVTTGAGDRWLRVVTAPTSWACGPAWTGNVDATGITGVRHPDVLDTAEWDEHDRRARAELMTLTPGQAIATDMALRDRVNLDDTWWTDLRASLNTLAAHPTDRVCLDADLLRLRILAAFGVTIDPDTLTWTTAHGDLHWANLTNPDCWILDWESWGTAPAGYDAALLHAVSLLRPETAEQVHATFADILAGPPGATAQLAATAKLLRLIEHGDHPDLAAPLHQHARTLRDTYF